MRKMLHRNSGCLRQAIKWAMLLRATKSLHGNVLLSPKSRVCQLYNKSLSQPEKELAHVELCSPLVGAAKRNQPIVTTFASVSPINTACHHACISAGCHIDIPCESPERFIMLHVALGGYMSFTACLRLVRKYPNQRESSESAQGSVSQKLICILPVSSFSPLHINPYIVSREEWMSEGYRMTTADSPLTKHPPVWRRSRLPCIYRRETKWLFILRLEFWNICHIS